MALIDEQCVPIQANEPVLSIAEAQGLLAQVPGWRMQDHLIEREFTFANFREAMAFVNRIAEIAEAQGHHPDIAISYNTVRLQLSTHKLGGLSRNDYILAAKINAMA